MTWSGVSPKLSTTHGTSARSSTSIPTNERSTGPESRRSRAGASGWRRANFRSSAGNCLLRWGPDRCLNLARGAFPASPPPPGMTANPARCQGSAAAANTPSTAAMSSTEPSSSSSVTSPELTIPSQMASNEARNRRISSRSAAPSSGPSSSRSTISRIDATTLLASALRANATDTPQLALSGVLAANSSGAAAIRATASATNSSMLSWGLMPPPPVGSDDSEEERCQGPQPSTHIQDGPPKAGPEASGSVRAPDKTGPESSLRQFDERLEGSTQGVFARCVPAMHIPHRTGSFLRLIGFKFRPLRRNRRRAERRPMSPAGPISDALGLDSAARAVR